jgi:colanic acid/amylovoran biosynthesis glycosyltransferase
VGAASDAAEDQEAKRRLLQAVDDAGLGKRVTIEGQRSIDDLVALYHEHDVLLAPSVHSDSGDNEGGVPVVVIEAAATGMPAVASRHCDIPDVVRHGEGGLLADERDVEGLAHHILALAGDTNRLVAMGAAARRRIEEDHDADRQADRAAALYDDAVQRFRA